MSKIQFNELNNSELEVLNTQETAEVVGGYYYPFSLSYFSSVNISEKVAIVNQGNTNFNSQVAFGGGKYSSNGTSNSTNQGNNLNINQ